MASQRPEQRQTESETMGKAQSKGAAGITPAELIILKHPTQRHRIQKCMKSWHKSTSGGTRWPLTGTFNPNYCDQVEAELRKKDLKNDKKHQKKRMSHTEQREVLQYFRMEGAQRQMAERQKTEQSETKPTAPSLNEISPPPPYKLLKRGGQFPLREVDGTITGTLEVAIKEKDKPQYMKAQAPVPRHRTKYRQRDREQITLEDEKPPAHQRRVHSLISRSESDLNHIPEPEPMTENLDRDSDADSERSGPSDGEQATGACGPQARDMVRKHVRSETARHSTPDDQKGKRLREEFSRLLEQYEEEERGRQRRLDDRHTRARRDSLVKHTYYYYNYHSPTQEQVEQWKREYEEREHQRLREGITCSGKAEEEERSSQSETQHGKNMRSPTSSMADPEESSETNPEELMAELRDFMKDLDKTLQDLKENIDRRRKDMEEEMKNLQMRERQLQKERERKRSKRKISTVVQRHMM